LDNLQLQQQYNIDELPIDEDFEQNFNNDDDDEQYPVFYQKERPYNVKISKLNYLNRFLFFIFRVVMDLLKHIFD